MSKTILVTGGAGFIGSNFIPYFLEENPDYQVLNLDLLTYAADLNYLNEVKDHPRYKFIEGDICNFDFIKNLFETYQVTDVIHFAAESHVDNSIKNPGAFIQTNIVGSFNLLHNAFCFWMDGPGQFKSGFTESRFHHISTDEVYGSLGDKGLFIEETPYAPNSPYSASKASSDMLARSYVHTYKMNITTTNCSNNYGPKQHNEKLIPTVIRKALQGEEIPIYGDGKNIRDWLYVLDHCKGINQVFHKGLSGETYNIGGDNEKNNLDICHTICSILDQKKPKSDGSSYSDQIIFVKDRPGHDFRYAIDASKIQKQIGWSASENFETGIMKTIDWYLDKFK